MAQFRSMFGRSSIMNRPFVASLISFTILFLLVGCNSTQQVKLLTPEQRGALIDSCQTVVKGKLVGATAHADLTFEENYLQPFPAEPKNGWEKNYTINVESVLKGSCSSSVLNLHNLEDPKYKDTYYRVLDLRPGKEVYVGWDKESCGGYDGLMIVNAEDQPATQQSNRQ